jgi:hypothetical protein
VTKLLQRLHDELVRRLYAATTGESYLKIVKAFSRHIGRRLDRVGPDDLRRYQVFLLEERKLAVGRWWPGERVLVHGAAGGIGTALLQLGRLAGLELYGTGSATQTGVISALGATAIDYTKSSFVERIRELTRGRRRRHARRDRPWCRAWLLPPFAEADGW